MSFLTRDSCDAFRFELIIGGRESVGGVPVRRDLPTAVRQPVYTSASRQRDAEAITRHFFGV